MNNHGHFEVPRPVAIIICILAAPAIIGSVVKDKIKNLFKKKEK